MTLPAILQPVRLGLRLRLAGIARRDAGRTEERLALLGLASLVVLVASALVHSRLLVAGERRDLVLGRIFLGLLTTALTLTLIPFLPPVGRCAVSIPPEWPFSAAQRGLADLCYALLGFWSALSVAIVCAVALTSPAESLLPGLVAGPAATVVVVVACALTRFLMEWLIPRAAQVVLALTLLAASSLYASGQADSVALPRTLPTLAIVDVFGAAAGPGERWRAAGVLVGQAALFVAGYLLAFRAGHWTWLESQERAHSTRSANAIARLRPLAGLLALRPAVGAAFLQQLTYLTRSPRAWFYVAYGPVCALLFVRQLAAPASPALPAFVLTAFFGAVNAPFLHNLFAFDGRGFALWQHAPVSGRDLLAGKDLAHFVWAAPSAVGLFLATWRTSGDLWLGLASVLLLGFFLLAHATVGNFDSAVSPAPLPLRWLAGNTLSGLGMVLSLLTAVVSCGLAGLTWWLAAGAGTGAILGAQGLLLLAASIVYRRLLASAAGALSHRRESLAALLLE